SAVVAVGRVAASLPYAALHPGPWPQAWSVAAALVGVAAAGGAAAFALHRRRFDVASPAARSVGVPGPMWASAALAGAALLAGVCAGGVLVAAARPDGRLHVTVLPVGAAPAVLIRSPQGGIALIDTGAQPDRLLRALGDRLPATTHTIDLLVLTGGERAAAAGLAGLRGHYAITRA